VSEAREKIQAALTAIRQQSENTETARQQQPDKVEATYYEKQNPESRSSWSGDSWAGGRSREG